MAECLCGCGGYTSRPEYEYIRSHKPFSVKFMENTKVMDSGCVEWTGKRLPTGYGLTCVAGKQMYTHRAVMLYLVGKDPEGFLVCHTCDNPPCVNQEHLYLGTFEDNARDRVIRRRDRNADDTHFNSKLSRQDVEAIIRSTGTQTTIAKRFGVTQSLVGMIKRGAIHTRIYNELLIAEEEDNDQTV